MSKGLEALQDGYGELFKTWLSIVEKKINPTLPLKKEDISVCKRDFAKNYNIIEKELRALEIIGRDVDAFVSLAVFTNGFNTYEEWEKDHPNCFTREEIKLLNEVLRNIRYEVLRNDR